MLAAKIIEPDTLVRAAGRLSINVRIPWYRALPLSSITGVGFEVDGKEVPTRSITWSVDGATYSLDELPERWDRSWYVLDTAVIEGDDVLGAESEGQHDVHVSIGLFIPYLPTADGVLAIAEQDTKTMAVQGRTV